MTIYYVDGTNGDDTSAGTGDAPWQTLGKAIAAVAPGDTIRARTATYRDSITFNKAGVTLEADEGHKPEIDGGYSAALFGKDGFTTKYGKQIDSNQLPYPSEANRKRGGWAIASTQGAITRLLADDTTLSGFALRNICGRAVGLKGNRSALRDCVIDFTYGGAIFLEDGDDIEVTGNVITRASMKAYDPTRDGVGSGGAKVQTAVIVKKCRRPRVTKNIVLLSKGEGISLDKGSEDPYAGDNIVGLNNHWSFGANGSIRPVFENNLAFYGDDPDLYEQLDKDEPADLFVIGNERVILPNEENPGIATIKGFVFRGNVLCGEAKRLFLVASGNSGRPVALHDGIVENNTIIGGRTTRTVFSWGTYTKNMHQGTVVRNNIILKHPDSVGELVKYEGGGDVEWGHNISNEPLPVGMRGPGDIVTDEPVLAAPFAPIIGWPFEMKSPELPAVRTSLDMANYRPRVGSPAIGGASDGKQIGALPYTDTPEPPDPDYGWLIEELGKVKEQIAAAKEQVTAASAVVATAGAVVDGALLRIDQAIALFSEKQV